MKRAELITALFDTMDVAKRTVHGHMRALVTGHSISHSQLELLFTIRYTQPTTATDLAQKLHLTPGAISQLVEELTGQKLIQRETDSADRRRQVISVSPDGQKLIKEFDARRRAVMNRVIDDLSDEELATWLKIHHHMIREFQTAHEQTQPSKNKETI